MLPKPELAYFAIADISGYTSFLAGVELDHAQDIIADFMDTVVKGLRPPFRLAKFEGDAAFVYAVAEKVDGSLLQDTIESAYFKFRRRLRDAIGNLRLMLEERQAFLPVIDEPPLIASGERFLTEPVKSN
jgi:hypothetical protein